MARRRFFAPPEAFHQKTVVLQADEAKHLREVLRLKPGDQVYVFNGIGNEYLCTVVQAKREESTLEISEEVDPPSIESPLKFTLAVALLKGEKFDLVVQKATELGINKIIPVMTRHADIHLRDASDAHKRVIRWRRIALEAAKQCGRASLPEIQEPISLETMIAEVESELLVLFSEREGQSLSDSLSKKVESVAALVGSEGGWAKEELTMAQESGWKIVTLGGRILRAETAAITVSALIQHAYGDLR